MKASLPSYGIANVLINQYFNFIGQEHLKQQALNFFTDDSVLDFNNVVYNGKAAIHQGLKTIPPFSYSVTSFDCMNVPNMPIVLIVITGYLFFEHNETKKFHSSFYLFFSGNKAVIKNQILRFIS